jgi:carboxypeptidase Taq
MKGNYDKYVNTMRKIADIGYSVSVLGWDKEVNMPPKGAAIRGQQVATLTGIAHELFTDPDFSKNLEALNSKKKKLKLKKRRNVEITSKKQKRANKFTTDFIMKKSKAISEGYHAWLKAREANDYGLFKDVLAKLVEIKKEECRVVGYKNHPYEALLSEYEPGAKVEELDALFADVRVQLVDFCQKIKEKKQVDNSFLHKHYGKDKQWDFGIDILKVMGYDFGGGRQDLSPHPFTTNFSSSDVRVTTRIDEQNLGSMAWSCIHEGGHALYEQGLPISEYGLPSGSAVSLGIHESQSRLWENNVGRSLPFWKANMKLVKKYFPEQTKGVGANNFFKAINKVEPSLVRVESDELYYHFHVLIRYEIEKGLLDGTYSTDNLNEVWNAKYKEYLGIDVPSDNEGILQDIHWAYGSIGYFPTYSLGSFYAAQFFAQAEKDIAGLQDKIEAGDTSELLEWLRVNIHQHGCTYSAKKLCKMVTGEPLNFKYFMDYAKEKYGRIYGI